MQACFKQTNIDISACRVGIYSDNFGQPGNLVSQANIFQTAGAGIYTIDIPDVTVSSGVTFWLGLIKANTFYLGSTDTVSTLWAFQSMVYGPLPNPAAAVTSTGNAPYLHPLVCYDATPTPTHTSVPVCTVTPGVTFQSETESNNSTVTANDLGTIGPSGLWVKGALDSDTDGADYFLFTASTTGYYDFTVDCRASEDFSLTIYCSGALVAMVSGSGLLHHPHFAQAGQYFHLRVSTTSGSGPYDLKLSATPFTASPAVCTATPGTAIISSELEPNDTSGAPQDLGSVGPSGIWIQGAVNMSADGSDYFSFTANTTGTYTFDLDCWNNSHLNLDATFYGCATCPGFASGLGLKTYTLNAISGTTYQIRVYPSSGGGFYDLKCH